MVADFEKKRNRDSSQGRLFFQIAGIIFLVILLVLFFADLKIYQKKRDLALQIIGYKNQIQKMEENSQILKEQIANSDNTDYLEKVAYEQLGQQKPGESQVIFVMPEKKPESVSTSENFWDIFTGWIGRPFNWIKNNF